MLVFLKTVLCFDVIQMKCSCSGDTNFENYTLSILYTERLDTLYYGKKIATFWTNLTTFIFRVLWRWW